MILTFDFETTTHLKGHPFTASNKAISYSVKVDDQEVSFNYYDQPDFLNELRAYMQQAKLLILFNGKFDLLWARRQGIVPPDKIRVWDCQIAEFIISGQRGAYPSLNECLAKYGLGSKDDKIEEYWKIGLDTPDIPVDELKFYNNLDVELTYKLYLKQQEVMTEAQKRLCIVMGLDLLVLADMEWNGIKFDVKLCKQKAVETEAALKEVTEKLLYYTGCPDLNLDSGQQLSCFLYGGKFELTKQVGTERRVFKSGARKGMDYDRPIYETNLYSFERLFVPLKGTEAKKPLKLSSGEETAWFTSAEDVLKQLKKPTKKHKEIIELLLKRAELAKLMDTYFGKLPAQLEAYGWGEYLHGQYNQCVAATGRLSSSNPNMQNFSGVVDQLLVTRYE
jgi:DNA polymerase I-like protein with 3'-5' exonuclease and polymerase domains